MSDELIGGRYQVIDCLRKTGFCETYVARDNQLPNNPRCIVKKLQPQSNEKFILETARRLFDNEARVLYKLGNHPQIPRLLAHLEVEKQFYLVQEFIEGKDLAQVEIVPSNPWQGKQVIAFLEEILEILAFVHQNNVIHRDIKPSNLIRRVTDGKIVLIDFGAVKEISNMTLTEGRGNLLTVAIGTPGYMSAEQQRGDPRLNSDIYAVGMTVIQAMTGFHPDQLPRDRQTGEICWHDHTRNGNLGLADIIDKMVRNDFRERYQNINEVLSDLKKLKKKPNQRFNQQSSPKNQPSVKPSSSKSLLWATIVALLSILAILSPRVTNVIRAINHYNSGNQLLHENKHEEAFDAFDRAVKIQPDFALAWTNRGYALGQLKKYVDKFSSCAQATYLEPDFAEAWNCRGLARERLKQYEDALKEYNQAILVAADDEQSSRAWYNKGQVLIKMDRYEEAIEATQEVLGLKPDYFLAWTQKCRALYELKQYQDAKTNCEISLSIEQNYQPTTKLLEYIDRKLRQEQNLAQ